MLGGSWRSAFMIKQVPKAMQSFFSFPILTDCSSVSSASFPDRQYQRLILHIRKLSQKIKLDDTIMMMSKKQEKQWMIVGSNKVRKIH